MHFVWVESNLAAYKVQVHTKTIGFSTKLFLQRVLDMKEKLSFGGFYPSAPSSHKMQEVVVPTSG